MIIQVMAISLLFFKGLEVSLPHSLVRVLQREAFPLGTQPLFQAVGCQIKYRTVCMCVCISPLNLATLVSGPRTGKGLETGQELVDFY